MKKIISILLVFIISLSMLFVVGCESDHDDRRPVPIKKFFNVNGRVEYCAQKSLITLGSPLTKVTIRSDNNV